MSKAVVLLSSGLDSTVNLYAAKRELDVVQVLTYDYGQRAASKEISQSQMLCKKLNLQHQVIELSWFRELTTSSLIDRSQKVPQGTEVKIDDLLRSHETAKSVWVPNRNGVFLNIAASFAEAMGAQFVIPGFNIEEAATFADNSQEYMAALDHSFSFSTANKIKVKCFTADKNKTEIVKMGRVLGVDFDLIWPCYFGGEKICGECESCLRFKRALEA